MSDRVTHAGAPGRRHGLSMHGRLTRAEALAKRRAYFERQRAEAEAALAIPDEDIVVTTYVGVWAQRNAQVVSE